MSRLELPGSQPQFAALIAEHVSLATRADDSSPPSAGLGGHAARRGGGEEAEEAKPARVYDPVAYTSTSRMDVDWIRRQRMADEDWIREYVEWAVDTGSTHIVTNDARLVVDARPTRMTITGVMSSGDRLQAEGGIEGSATDVNGHKVNLRLGQTLLHNKANMNLLGANELLRKGNIIHLETGNSYMIVRTRGGVGLKSQ